MPEAAEILCSRCGTPFPKDKGKTAVTCVVCGQLRPDLDLTLDDDDDEDLGAAMSAGAGGGGASVASSSGGGVAAPAMDQDTHVLRVASSSGMGGGIDSPAPPPLPEMPRSTRTFRLDHMPSAEPRMPQFGAGDLGAPAAAAAGDSLTERVGPVLLVVCPLVAGMAGGLNMLSRTDDFSTGTWYAVAVVFVAMLVGALAAGLAVAGLFYVVRVRWTILLRALFIAAAAAVGYYGMEKVPSHIQVRPDGLPGLVLRR